MDEDQKVLQDSAALIAKLGASREERKRRRTESQRVVEKAAEENAAAQAALDTELAGLTDELDSGSLEALAALQREPE